MTPEELLKAIAEVADGLRTDMAVIGKKCDAIGARHDELKQLKSDGKKKDDVDDATMAQRTAADSVDPAAFAALTQSVADLKRRQSRPMADLNKFADAQAKADSVMRALGSAAEPPMAGEDLVAYKIRTHRKMQPHSPRWKGVDLQIIAADQVALDIALDGIRADAMAASMDTSGMKPLEHRMLTKQLPGGHISREFIGNGTFVKQLSRPVRHVQYIGPRWAGAGA
ncbi:hypothetical protein EDE08_103520 [Bradyrhizobium sp. R2.2-H]|jgi:hypothetical protein|uniref:hypothetical protein n=1 Tax=unclassified Bradyrhizobium TaxID=2631580 RepID=UPI00104D4837|nr:MULTISPECIES: hypothetical protein [unclassified Bradyrhizobium]TCU75300.1 hypothetical protein EDE10_103519 [Bradyrhizobium sp. Y-H1]TCU78068.1 hypothetical protein EDE08_103520 [Bradyrhizobium sp. R2.2-H]